MVGKLDREFIMPIVKLRSIIIYFQDLLNWCYFVKLKFISYNYAQFEGYFIKIYSHHFGPHKLYCPNRTYGCVN